MQNYTEINFENYWVNDQHTPTVLELLQQLQNCHRALFHHPQISHTSLAVHKAGRTDGGREKKER